MDDSSQEVPEKRNIYCKVSHNVIYLQMLYCRHMSTKCASSTKSTHGQEYPSLHHSPHLIDSFVMVSEPPQAKQHHLGTC